MDTDTFTFLLENPDNISSAHTRQLAMVVEKYPFLQSARALYLKALQSQESHDYNKELKRTAARTLDRTMLFEFITSPVFYQHKVSSSIKAQDKLRAIQVSQAVDVTNELEEEERHKAHELLDPDFFIPKNAKHEQSTPPLPPGAILQEGEPLKFTREETHSFSEWLKITSLNPIDRSDESDDKEQPNEQELQELPPERKRKIKLIDQFIANNPKIKIKAKDEQQSRNSPDLKDVPDEHLMTETLARVYVEQKNFKKAKQAYKILSLKYPEKSGFFADQIRAIEELQDFKN